MGKLSKACRDLYSLMANGCKDVTVIKKKVKIFIRQTKKKLRKTKIGNCLMQSMIEDICDCIEYLEKLPQCKRVTKLQGNLENLNKILKRKMAFQNDNNDFYQENYDTDSNNDDDEEEEDDDNDADGIHDEEQEDFYEEDYPDDDDYSSEQYKQSTMMKNKHDTVTGTLPKNWYWYFVPLSCLRAQKIKSNYWRYSYDDDWQSERLSQSSSIGAGTELGKNAKAEDEDENYYEDATNCGDVNKEQGVANENYYETSTNYGHVDEGETESKQATVKECENNNMEKDTDNEKVEFISDKSVGAKNPMLKTKSIDQSNVNSNLYSRDTGVVESVPGVCPHGGVCIHQHRAGDRAWPLDPGG